MAKHEVTFFKPYGFTPGQKINIVEGPRRGDWEVAAVTGTKVTLRCPVSGREFTWNRFCYALETRRETTWPQKD